VKYIIKYNEALFNYEYAYLKYSYDYGAEPNDENYLSKNFNGFSGVHKATKFAKEIIEEHLKFNEEKGFVVIAKNKESNQYKDLIKWYGNCEWKILSGSKLSNVYIYNKYLYGLEAAYEKFILPSKNCYLIIKYIKENLPDMWNILLLHNPEIQSGSKMGEMGF